MSIESEVRIEAVMTGQEFDSTNLQFIGTILLDQDLFVLHVFKEATDDSD